MKDKILEALQTAPATFSELLNRCGGTSNSALADDMDKKMKDKILEALQRAPATFSELLNRCGLPNVEFRSLDRELQRMRRQGSILFDKKMRKWRVTTTERSSDEQNER